jgi:predicted dehydrogenase
MKKTKQVGFVGGGLNSAVGSAHFGALRMDREFELVAGCFSRTTEINQETAHFYGVEEARTYESINKMIDGEKGKLDALILLTPTPAHFDHLKLCQDNGIPVICEKAMVCNSSQADEIVAAEKIHNGFLAMTYNYTGYPALRELRQLIRDGQLGNLTHFIAEMPQEGFLRKRHDGSSIVPQEWRLHDGQIPMVYLDLCVHLHQVTRYLIDERPVKVSASQKTFGNFSEIVDWASATVDYTSGIQGLFLFGKVMLGCRNGLNIRVFGTKGAAHWVQANPEELRLAYDDGRIEILDRGGAVNVANKTRYTRFKAGHPVGFVEAFANLYRDIGNCLDSYHATKSWESDEVFGSSFVLSEMRFLEAMVDSASTGASADVIFD